MSELTVSRPAMGKIVQKLYNSSIFSRLRRLTLRVRPKYNHAEASNMVRRLRKARPSLEWVKFSNEKMRWT